jgi:ABC-2 type transport system permease protein
VEDEMVAKIARKEMLEMMRDGRFRWASGIVLALLVAALLMGWKHHQQLTEQRDAAQAADQQQWIAQGARNPHSAAHFGKYAFKPATPVSFLDRGLNSYLGIAVWLEAHYQNPFRYRPAEDATAVQRFGELTAAVVLQLLVPLLIVILTFSVFAGEREQGTLRQLLSLGVRKNSLAFGKALGVSGALLLLLVPATQVGVAALALAATGDASDGLSASWGRFIAMILSYLCYFGAFLGISLAVSAVARTARMALLILIAFWIVNGLITPRAVADAAQAIHPAPSHIEFWDQVHKDMREGIDGHDPSHKRTEDAKKMLLAQYKVDRVEDLPINFAGWSLQQGEEYGNSVFDKRYGGLWSIFERQNRVHDLGAICAPLLAVRSLSMSFAGTDVSHHLHFATKAEEHRRVINKMLNEDMMYNAGRADYGYMANADLWARVPQFQYELPGVVWALRTQALPIALLAFWFLASSVAAVIAVRRMRVD